MGISQAEEYNSFHMKDLNIRNLKELLDALQNPDLKEIAKEYIREGENDYANWIRDVLNDSELADRIAEKNTISEMIGIIKQKLDETGTKQQEQSIQPLANEQIEGTETSQPQPASHEGHDPQEEAAQEPFGNPVDESPKREEDGKEQTQSRGYPDSKGSGDSGDTRHSKKGSESLQEQQPKAAAEANMKEPAQDLAQQTGETKKLLQKEEKASPALLEPPENLILKDRETTKDEAKPLSHTKILKKANDPRHFCPRFFECMKKEFLFGFGMGIIVGIVTTMIFRIFN